MTSEELKERLKAFEHDDRPEWLSKKKTLREYLLVNGERHLPLLLESLNTENQSYLGEVSEILGLLGRNEAIPVLRQALEKEEHLKDAWGFTIRNIAVALIRLGDMTGLECLKSAIKNTEIHRDMRVRSARALIALGFKDVFSKDEVVDCTGASLPGDWPEKLRELVQKLAAPK